MATSAPQAETSASLDEAKIIAACQAGNFDRFAELFDLYHRRLYTFIYYRTHHRQTAEDITSTVFMKAFDGIGTFRPDRGNFSSWLYRIARNAVIDHYRSFKAAADIEDAWDISANVDIERDTDVAAKLEEVRQFLSQLPRQQRDVVVMRVWDGLSHKEIAEILGISEANAKMTYSRAMARIHKEIVVAMVAIAATMNFYNR
jgi:RNA polymerase sigma-70 factor (ECF subfamily)